MAKLEQQRTGSKRLRNKLGLIPGGFLAPKSGPPVGVRLKNKLNKVGDAISRKADDIAFNASNRKKDRQEVKSSITPEETPLTINTSDSNNTTIGYDTNKGAADRYSELILGQPIANPNTYAATLAGGSKPMTAMNNPQIDPITGMPITPGGQPNMNPNFIGGMANSNIPTTAMLAQEKSVFENLKEFGGRVMGDLEKADSLAGNFIDKAALKMGILNEKEYAKRIYDPNKTKIPQDKAMPKGAAGRGIRGLAPSVQENMGYDPLSQERLTQSRRSTKCMRVKKK
jgi:hypothetical protein